MENVKQALLNAVKNPAFPKRYLTSIMTLSFLLFACCFLIWMLYLQKGFYIYYEYAVQTAYAATATASVGIFGYPVFLRLSQRDS